jgi:hypothetical protein
MNRTWERQNNFPRSKLIITQIKFPFNSKMNTLQTIEHICFTSSPIAPVRPSNGAELSQTNSALDPTCLTFSPPNLLRLFNLVTETWFNPSPTPFPHEAVACSESQQQQGISKPQDEMKPLKPVKSCAYGKG